MTTWEKSVEERELAIAGSSASGDDSQLPAQNLSFEHLSDGGGPWTVNILKAKLIEWNQKVEAIPGLEAHGVTQVLPKDKHEGGLRTYVLVWLLWFSINLVANNIITGLLGPLIFALGWIDSVCIVIFATGLAAAGPSYMATFGPESGLRTMIGWGIIGCIIAGQMLSAVDGHGLTIAVGCVISALCIGIVAAIGIPLVYRFERYAFIPQLVAILVLIGSAGRDFNTHALSIGTAGTVTANRCSYFVLIIGSIIGFAAISPDFYVYHAKTTPKWITFTATWSGMWMALMFCNLVGIGIATGVANKQNWSDAYLVSSGALLLECYEGLGGFGKLCVVILALGSITNNAPCSYSAALTIQALSRRTQSIPRWVWVIVIMVVELACSVAGRNHLFNIFENFLPLMSYWVCPWLTIAVEEHLIFHVFHGRKFDWVEWENQCALPIGIAALVAFLCGWAGAVIGMQQVWWQGPLALKVGGYGGDIGTWLSIGFAGFVFPPLRYIELRMVGR